MATKDNLTVQLRKGLVKYYYVVLAKNGQVLVVSQKYFSHSNARRAARKSATQLNATYVERDK